MGKKQHYDIVLCPVRQDLPWKSSSASEQLSCISTATSPFCSSSRQDPGGWRSSRPRDFISGGIHRGWKGIQGRTELKTSLKNSNSWRLSSPQQEQAAGERRWGH